MIYTYYASEQTHNHPQLTPVLIWSVEWSGNMWNCGIIFHFMNLFRPNKCLHKQLHLITKLKHQIQQQIALRSAVLVL